MAIVDIVQRTEEWFVWRGKGITASMIPVIMGLSPYQTRYQLWAELVGLKKPDDLSKNFHVQRGVEQEPEARAAIEKELGMPFLPVCAEADHNGLFKASLDGFFSIQNAEDIVLEIKCPCEKIYNDIIEQQSKSENFRMYMAQVQWQLNVAGAKKAYLYFYLRGKTPICVTINRNDKFIEKAEAKALEFWDLIQSKTQPELVQGRDKVVYDLKEQVKDIAKWDKNVSSYKTLAQEIKKVDEQRSELKLKMKEFEDFFAEKIPEDVQSFDKDGIRATQVTRTGKVDQVAFLQHLVEKVIPNMSIEDLTLMQNEFRKEESSHYRFTVQAEQKEEKVNNKKPKKTPKSSVMTDPKEFSQDNIVISNPQSTTVTESEMNDVIAVAEKAKAEVKQAVMMPAKSFKEQASKNVFF